MKEDEDNVRIDPRLIRIGLQAIDAVAAEHGVNFFDIDIDQKKLFLSDHGQEIIASAKRGAGHLGRYFENRMVVLIENEGSAGLYFTKVKK